MTKKPRLQCIPAEVFAPGEYIQEEIDERGWIREQLAWALGLSQVEVVELLKGRSRVTPEIAERLAKLFGTSAQMWLSLQAAYDRAKKGK